MVRVESPTHYVVLGETVDDAAGEAFDKLAKLLDLGYPGGPLVERHARGGDPRRFALPRPMLGSNNYDFSFSGLKTAVARLVRDLGGSETVRRDAGLLANVCASFQEAVVEVLLKKAGAALEELGGGRGAGRGWRELAVVGGVACNGRLRAAVEDYLPGVRAVFPPPALCTDNAAMIAGLAFHLRGRENAGRDMGGTEVTEDGSVDLTLNATADHPLGVGKE